MTTYKADIPAEPPIGSVVKGDGGKLWLRVSDSAVNWIEPLGMFAGPAVREGSPATLHTNWVGLLQSNGELEEIYRP